MDSDELARRIGLAWEKLTEPRHPFSLEIIAPGRPSVYVNLGPHPPRLWPEDLDRAHDLWLAAAGELRVEDPSSGRGRGWRCGGWKRILKNERRDEVIEDLGKELRKS